MQKNITDFETRTELNLIQGLKVQSVKSNKELKKEIESFLESRTAKGNEILQLLRKKVESNEKEVFEIKNRLIESSNSETRTKFQINQSKINKNQSRIRVESPGLHYSTVTKKNLINLQNDLQNFKNEMRHSLSANESGVRERLKSIGRSIKHLQVKPSPRLKSRD